MASNPSKLWQIYIHQSKDKDEPDEDDGIQMVQEYTKEQDSHRLHKIGEPSHMHPNHEAARATECRVRETPSNSTAHPSWHEGNAADLREARNRWLSHEIVAISPDTCHEPLEDLCMQPSGITRRHPTRADHLKHTHLRDMLTNQCAIVPRAWDHRDAHEHFARLYAALNPKEYGTTMRRIFRSARHHMIPPYVQDVLYKILVSGHNIGPNKRRGAEAKCSCGMDETLEHAFAQCNTVKTLWLMVVARWNDATGQTLDAKDLRVTLLGDRGDQEHAITEHLWNMTRAATIWIVHKTGKARREGSTKTTTAAAMLTSVKQMLQRLVASAWTTRQSGDNDAWAAWRNEHWITVRRHSAHVRVLQGGFTNGLTPNGSPACSADLCQHCTTEDEERANNGQHAQPVAPHANTVAQHANTVARQMAREMRHAPNSNAPPPNATQPTGNTTAHDLGGAQQMHGTCQPTRPSSCTCKPVPVHIFTDGAWQDPSKDGDATGPVAVPLAGHGAVELTEYRRRSIPPQNARHCNTAAGSARTRSGDTTTRIPIGQLTTCGTDQEGHAYITWVHSGTVITDPGENGYVGANAHTNNTGELSAIHHALKRALDTIHTTPRTTIHTDSLYAMHMTTGKWMPRNKGRRNANMIVKLRGLWRRIQRTRPGAVELAHVRSHTGVPGNEIADWLADKGTHDDRSATTAQTDHWIRQWLNQHTPPAGDATDGDSARPPGRPR